MYIFRIIFTGVLCKNVKLSERDPIDYYMLIVLQHCKVLLN